MRIDPFSEFRQGDLRRIDRVALALRQSPIRPPAIATHPELHSICIYSPAPLIEAAGLVRGTLIDASADVCRWAKRRCTGGVGVVGGSLHRLPLPSNIVDEFVVPAYTLQTLDDSSQMLGEIRRVLRPGIGRLLTWWLLWPLDATRDSVLANEVVSTGAVRSSYRLAEDAITIERVDETGQPFSTLERWEIRAARRAEVDAVLGEAGFTKSHWVQVTPSNLGGVTIGEVECHA